MCNTKSRKIRHTKLSGFFILQPKEPQGVNDLGFTAREVMTGKKSREPVLMVHLDLLEITRAQARQSFSLICGSHCPPQEPQSEMSRQLLGGTTRATVQQPLLGLLPSILSQENMQEEQRRGGMTFHNTLQRQLHTSSLERNSFNHYV